MKTSTSRRRGSPYESSIEQDHRLFSAGKFTDKESKSVSPSINLKKPRVVIDKLHIRKDVLDRLRRITKAREICNPDNTQVSKRAYPQSSDAVLREDSTKGDWGRKRPWREDNTERAREREKSPVKLVDKSLQCCKPEPPTIDESELTQAYGLILSSALVCSPNPSLQPSSQPSSHSSIH